VGIGGSIFLIVVGAILTFAVDVSLSGLDLNVVGVVLMLAGAVGLILTLWFWNSRRRTVVTSHPADERRVVRETYREVPPTDRPL
jgi:protein-S-isoprenylcysteine O-methyltransferase Ste14